MTKISCSNSSLQFFKGFSLVLIIVTLICLVYSLINFLSNHYQKESVLNLVLTWFILNFIVTILYFVVICYNDVVSLSMLISASTLLLIIDLAIYKSRYTGIITDISLGIEMFVITIYTCIAWQSKSIHIPDIQN